MESTPNPSYLAWQESRKRSDTAAAQFYTAMREHQANGEAVDARTELMNAVASTFLSELEIIGTEPEVLFGSIETAQLHKLLLGEKVEGDLVPDWGGLLVRIGQQFRASPEDIELLRQKFVN